MAKPEPFHRFASHQDLRHGFVVAIGGDPGQEAVIAFWVLKQVGFQTAFDGVGDDDPPIDLVDGVVDNLRVLGDRFG